MIGLDGSSANVIRINQSSANDEESAQFMF